MDKRQAKKSFDVMFTVTNNWGCERFRSQVVMATSKKTVLKELQRTHPKKTDISILDIDENIGDDFEPEDDDLQAVDERATLASKPEPARFSPSTTSPPNVNRRKEKKVRKALKRAEKRAEKRAARLAKQIQLLNEYRACHTPSEVAYEIFMFNRWPGTELTAEEDAELTAHSVRHREQLAREKTAREENERLAKEERIRNAKELELLRFKKEAEQRRLLDEYRTHHTPRDVAYAIFSDSRWTRVWLTDEERVHLTVMQKEHAARLKREAEEARRAEAEAERLKALRREAESFRARHSVQEFAAECAFRPAWRDVVDVGEDDAPVFALAQEEKKRIISVDKAAQIMGVSPVRTQLWMRLGWLRTLSFFPAKLDRDALPSKRRVKSLAAKDEKLPPSARAWGYCRQADVLARGWSKAGINSWIGKPDRIETRHGVSVYMFSLQRVMRCEEMRAKTFDVFRKKAADAGFAMPPSIANVEAAVRFVINHSPHIGGGNAKLLRHEWKVVKTYSVGKLKFLRSASIPFSDKISTWQALRALVGKIDKKVLTMTKAWDLSYATIRQIIDKHAGAGLLPEIISQAVKQMAAKDWNSPDAASALAACIKHSTISHVLSLSKFQNTFGERMANRQLIGILGPTNSGKTYDAFEHLMRAKTGIYLAPLRLMAAEGWDKMNQFGVSCSLLTGEEQKFGSSDTHISATVEMVPLGQEFEVAVIDEVQMLSDPDRGWAWTNAIFGVNAKTVYLVGAPQSENLLRKMAAKTNEHIDVVFKERFTPLKTSPAISSIYQVPKASAVVSFSRAGVLKSKVNLGDNCGVIYGALSPEVRREEARRFAANESHWLAATDAIGMGLNLPIKTIIFERIEKWDGNSRRLLTATEVQQIAGRAGRFGLFDEGLVTAFEQEHVDFLARRLQEVVPQLPQTAQIGPHLHMLEMIAQKTGVCTLSEILRVFQQLPVPRGLFRKADLQDVQFLADSLPEEHGLTIKAQFDLCCCPVDSRSDLQVSTWRKWVRAVTANKEALLPPMPHSVSATDVGLFAAEEAVKVRNGYRWLHYKFSRLFPQADIACTQVAELNAIISRILRGRIKRTCKQCGCTIHSYHAMCDTCFRESRADFFDC